MDNLIAKYGDKRYSFSKKPEISFSPMDVGLKVPNDGYKYVQIKHDPEVYGEPNKELDAYPSIANDVIRRWFDPSIGELRAYDYVTLNRDWQFFMRDLWSWSMWETLPYGKWEGKYKNASNPDMVFDKYTVGSLLWYYADMIQDARSHTDSEPPEAGFCDFVTQRNMGKKPYSWLTKTTTGNLERVIADEGNYWRVEALDLSKPPPKIKDIENKPWLLHWATEQNSVQRLPDKSYVVARYPQAKVLCRYYGYPETGTPIPNVSLGGSYLISKKRCRVLMGGQNYSPYNPAK